MSLPIRSLSADLYTKIILTAIAISLAVLAFRPALRPTTVQAQADSPRFYVEPGNTLIRKPGGELQVQGRMMIDLRNGDIWGFPTNTDLPYPVDLVNNTVPVIGAIYLGRFDLSTLKPQK
jgi:hypothetical protein